MGITNGNCYGDDNIRNEIVNEVSMSRKEPSKSTTTNFKTSK